MKFRQDLKKLYVRATFIFGWWASLILYIYIFLRASYDIKEIIFVIIMLLFPLIIYFSYYWYYFEINDGYLNKFIFNKTKSIKIEDITELSYEDNPARPLVYITFNKPNGGEDYFEFTTGVWSPNTLHELNDELQRKNPNIVIKIDEKTKKQFEKEKDYHLQNPKRIIGWAILGLKQISLGVGLGFVIVIILKLF